MTHNVFISHASEDKDEVARPLAVLLTRAGLQVWLDEGELVVGDSLRRSIELRPIPLLQQIERIVEREKQNGEVVVVEVHEEIVVLGEPELLSRAVGNVLRNAIRYAGKAGPITIQATRANDETVIAISDQGPGVPEASLPRIFDAFYRPDIARTRETGGNGLGLAIVKTCLEAMHGSVTARNRSGGGLIVEMTLLSE